MEPSKGFVVVASKRSNFYLYAINLMETVKDYYPEAHITFVTEKHFLDGREDIADNIILCDDHYRAKLWGMAQTPYDITMYIDADMECEHEDIMTVWDNLGDNDLVFHELTVERSKYYTVRHFELDGVRNKGWFKLCGGVCLYRSSNPLVMEFMREWFFLYDEQLHNTWKPECFTNEKQWDKDLRHFDQTTLWYMINKIDKYKDLKIGFFEDDIRWNYFTQYQYDNLQSKSGKPPIFRHFSGCLSKDDAIV